jgi:hypothetical protein
MMLRTCADGIEDLKNWSLVPDEIQTSEESNLFRGVLFTSYIAGYLDNNVFIRV